MGTRTATHHQRADAGGSPFQQAATRRRLHLMHWRARFRGRCLPPAFHLPRWRPRADEATAAENCRSLRPSTAALPGTLLVVAKARTPAHSSTVSPLRLQLHGTCRCQPRCRSGSRRPDRVARPHMPA
eukprot:scaffold143291_cov136-Phaeocystis_antarctica.AAC.1